VLLGPAALALRDRWPITALVVAVASTDVYVGLGYPYGPIFVGVAVAMFTAVQTGRRAATWAVTAAGYAGFVVADALDPRAVGSLSAVRMALVAGWIVVVLAVSEVVRVKREQRAAAARSRREEVLRRAGEQRLMVAQELHDVLAHHLSLINVQASVALHLIDEQPERARTALGDIKAASRDSLHELRAALDLLRSGEPATAPRTPAPRLADLPGLVEGVGAGGLDVRLEETGPATALPAAVELAAYRIVQEALTNVTRHARARSVVVRLCYDDGVTVEVVDDGVGGTAEAGNGINGMRERAEALGGRVDAGPDPAAGFRVTAHLPARRR
jgi:signal transduction histidine kinase